MKEGELLFARYALMPNRLGYCGGDDHRALLDYCLAQESDPGLNRLLRQFQAAYPYLKLIAETNGIRDAFHPKVVEAYWVGNELLDGVSAAQFYESLRSRFANQLSPKTMEHLLGKVPLGARAHHSFHVLDVHSRVGMLEHSLDTLDKCRIGWGKIERVEGTYFIVRYQPVVLEAGKLKLGDLEEKQVLRSPDGRSLELDAHPGDHISFHWDCACDLLTPRQVSSLEKYTRYHLVLANQTL